MAASARLLPSRQFRWQGVAPVAKIFLVSSPLPLAPFPLTLLSDQLTLAEFFHFNAKTAQIQTEYDVKRRLDIQAYAVESPEVWNAPLESPEQDRGYTVPERLLLIAFTTAMRDLLFEVGMTCGRKKDARHLEADVQDGVGILSEIFAKMREDRIPLTTVPFRVRGYDASLAMAVLARTPPAIARLMKTLRISKWNISMMPGWSCHNRGQPMPIARMPEDVSMGGFFEEANRCCNARAGEPVFLNVQLYVLLSPSAPIPRDQPPERLIVATNDPTLRTALQKAATSVGAPHGPQDLNGFVAPINVGQPGFFAGFFRDMERHDLPVLASRFHSETNEHADEAGMFVLVRTPQAVTALLDKLGIGGLEPFGN